MDELKYKIALILLGNQSIPVDPTYEELLLSIYDNAYNIIFKCPINIFIVGLLNTFIIKDSETKNRILIAIKEVTEECLGCSGIEQTFVDDDWENLDVTKDKYNNDIVINKQTQERITKDYMSEFFEI